MTADSNHADVVILTALKDEYDQLLKVTSGAEGSWSTTTRLKGAPVSFQDFETSKVCVAFFDPDTGSGLVQVSFGNGFAPTWSADGASIYYMSAYRGWVEAEVETEPSLQPRSMLH